MAASGGTIEAIYPLTPVQEGILFHVLYAPDSPLYFQQYTAVIDGDLDVASFRAAWQLVASRHPALRSLLTWEGRERPLQVVRTTVEPEWCIEDWRTAGAGDVVARWHAFLEADRARGFVLDVAPLMRFALFRVADDAHRFVWSHHHVVIDGWSMGIVLDEVFAAYEALNRGAAPELPAPAPYREYVRWLHSHDDVGAEAHWRQALGGFTSATSLRVERPTTSRWAERHAEEILRLPATTTERLGLVARRNGLTLNTMLRGAWALVLGRYSGDDDVVFGATFAGRPPELDRATEMVGLFINTLPVRARIRPDLPLGEWLAGLQRKQIAAAAHEATPLSDVQAWSEVPKGEPLFQSLLVFENVPHPAGASGSLATSEVRYLQRSNYPLAVLVMPGVELELIVLFDADRYDAALVRRMARQLARVLEAMSETDLTQPVSAVPFFPDGELHELLVRWNDTAAAYPDDRTVHSLILAEAERAPSAPAVVGETSTLTYADLVSRATVVARRLQQHGIGAGVRVGVAVDRSPGTVVAILGVLLAGGAYVPLDPHQPPARLAYLLADTAAAAVIAAPGLEPDAVPAGVATVAIDEAGRIVDEGPEPLSPAAATRDAGPDDLAYVLFTSGSTGRPKGVAVTHRSLVNSTHARLHAYGDRVGTFLLLSPFIFDSSIAGLFSSLTQGGTLVLPAPDMEKDVRHLARLITEHGVTHTLALPALYDLLLDHADPAALRSLRLVMVAGEACPPSLVRRHHERVPGARLANEYGPTEATVWCTVHNAEPVTADAAGSSGRVPIGRPIANTKAFVLDDRGRPVPVGVPGELHIGGLGLARGYLGHPELTEERFVDLELPVHGPIRLYRTGDVARFLPDGSLDLIGRRDHQVKIRGQRIELGEIEMVLREHPEVRDAVVVVRDDAAATGAQSLVAYAETAAGGAGLRSYVAERLPDVMVPSVVVPLPELPKGATGKVARAELPEPEETVATVDGGHVAPQGEAERTLAEIWEGVLGVENIGATDNFFDLGGDSILSIRIIARAHEAGLAITPRQFFEFPTIAELARVAAGAAGDTVPPATG